MKRKLIIYNIFIVLVLICTSVYAATTAKLDLVTTPDSKQIKSGEKFTTKLSLKDFSTTTSVDTISGYIDIDENTIEDITIDNIVKTSGNTVKIGNENLEVYDVANIEGIPEKGIFLMKDPATDDDTKHDYKITIELSAENKISTDEIIKIEFKTKDNLKEDTYADVVKFVGFEATSGWTETVTIEDDSLSIKIVKDSVDNNTVNNNTVNNNTVNNNTVNNNTANNNTTTTNNKVNNNAVNNNSTNKNTTKNTVNTNKTPSNSKDNTLANKVLPATGATSIIIKIIAVGMILGFVVYVKYKKYKNI